MDDYGSYALIFHINFSMKTILVLTDFTNNAGNAASSAMMLSEKLHARLLLFNSFYNMPILPSYGGVGGPWVVEDLVLRAADCDKKLKQLAADLTKKVTTLSFESHKPLIAVQCGEGELSNNIKTVLQETDVELIAMGARAGSTISHIFTGSDTSAVIDNATRPVLIIPEKTGFKALKKVTFATNFGDMDLSAIQYLHKLCKIFRFQLEIIHVSLFWSIEEDNYNKHKSELFRDKLSKLNFLEISCKEVKGKDVINRLNRLCAEHGSDLLVMVHYKDGLMSRIFQESATKEALANQRIPLLVIPAKMEEHIEQI
jgi:nucleotide-binding universal stress UspA family protein